ncbi:TetR/AcrR family transcriptional regulator [Litorihabitans aurantiacus]|uniref:TetR/AcrR family transcriptional regulator n=1 Tax=Litorihabitans aurantiacus TaxID=1930061 RepID=UPI0024E099E1|nr:TetR/AcrR family transcriptional regulator [Litorihabitans aurantiacus]
MTSAATPPTPGRASGSGDHADPDARPAGGSPGSDLGSRTTAPLRRDVARNQGALLEAAARVFTTSGVGAPVREIAAAAGVGVATLYRHFPTRADLVVAVYRHQIEECAAAGPSLLASAPGPFEATLSWVHLFVDFLGTKHGLSRVWEGDAEEFGALHALFVERLVPVLTDLLDAGRAAGEVVAPISAYRLLRAVGDLVAWSPQDPDYDVREVVTLLVSGLRQAQPDRLGDTAG